MTPEIVNIGFGQLLIGLVFILAAGLLSLYHSLKLERDLLVGTVRTFVQLFLLGFILKFIFNFDNPGLVLCVFGFMIFASISLGGALFFALICKKRVAAR